MAKAQVASDSHVFPTSTAFASPRKGASEARELSNKAQTRLNSSSLGRSRIRISLAREGSYLPFVGRATQLTKPDPSSVSGSVSEVKATSDCRGRFGLRHP